MSMKQVMDSRRTKWGHDYDGVHNRYSTIDDIYKFLGDVKMAALTILFPSAIDELGERALLDMGIDYYKRTGDGLLGFVELAVEKMGVDRLEFHKEIHELYNQINFQKTMAEYPHLFERNASVIQRMKNLSSHVQHGLVTQSCLKHWATKGLELQGLYEFFDPKALVGFFEGGAVTKALSPQPVETLMGLMNAKPEEFVFFEDTIPNLAKAKEIDERILTVHICETETEAPIPDCIDIRVQSYDTFVRQHAEPVFLTQRLQQIQTFEMHIS